MPFYTYMLRCNDASYYVGHTDDLEERIADHNSGGFSAYTRKRRPVTLVWSDEFQTREEALSRESRSRVGLAARKRH
jgi:predicted GIY-YIG superfamily endonuclease